MSEEASIGPAPENPSTGDASVTSNATPEKSGGGCLKIGGIGCLILVLILVGVAIGLWIAMTRGHSDTNLNAKEQAVVEKKLAILQDEGVPDFVPGDTDVIPSDDQPTATLPDDAQAALAEVSDEDIWEDDEVKRVIRFTQREINGWLTSEPNLKDKLRIELGEDEVTARLHMILPDDSPVLAGKKVKVKGKIKIIINQSRAHASIESLTVAGFAVPSAILGGAQGSNLLEQMFDSPEALETFHKIVEEFSINSDGVTIRLAE